MILEDLTFGKKHPSVLDLKIGRTTWQPNSPHEKRRKMEKKDADSTSSKIGARMIGFSVRSRIWISWVNFSSEIH